MKISTKGETIELASHVVPGKVTVVDFYAEWCEPCRKVDEHHDIALRKVDIVDWGSQVAQQHMKSVPSLPYLIVYDRNGKQVAAISGLDLEKLDAAIAEARSR